MAPKQNIFEVLVEKYRFWIGGILILAIVGGSGVLIYRENYAKPKLEDRIAKLEDRIGELESSEKLSKSELQISNQNTNVQTEQVQATTTTQQSTNTTAAKPISGKININTATSAELDTLPGIGTAYAGRIIEYRNAHGGFKSTEEIKNVKGIGDKTFEKFRNNITI